jgi:hypothetical protein
MPAVFYSRTRPRCHVPFCLRLPAQINPSFARFALIGQRRLESFLLGAYPFVRIPDSGSISRSADQPTQFFCFTKTRPRPPTHPPSPHPSIHPSACRRFSSASSQCNNSARIMSLDELQIIRKLSIQQSTAYSPQYHKLLFFLRKH